MTESSDPTRPPRPIISISPTASTVDLPATVALPPAELGALPLPGLSAPPGAKAGAAEVDSQNAPQSATSIGATQLLRTFHAHLGKPVPRLEPRPAPIDTSWTAHYQIQKLLGQGSQGVVYLARREGADGYFTNVALKLFYRSLETTREEYLHEMARIAAQAQRVSLVQHDNLVSIRDFVAVGETRVMVLEWIDGRDLSDLLDHSRFDQLKQTLSRESWEHLNNVIATRGEDHLRLKPGVAVDILRGCLEGLSFLHHNGIVHCDLKPSNIMVKRTGIKKIIDVDSSCMPAVDPVVVRGTPYYMAPEQLEGRPLQAQCDIASLGYILIEMLTGRLLFRECMTTEDLLKAKLSLPSRLDAILPADVRRSTPLRSLISKMVVVNPKDRFPDAEAVEVDRRSGAGLFHQILVKMDLATEYNRELAWWLEALHDGEEGSDPTLPGDPAQPKGG